MRCSFIRQCVILMKSMKSVCLFFVLAMMALSACEKELSYESRNPVVTEAKGTLLDSNGNCTGTIAGIWYNGVVPGDTNFVLINVNVTQAGSYSIQSITTNGVSFSAAGNFTTTGANQVQLKSSGTFSKAVGSVFTYSFDSSVCSFTINVQDSTGKGLGSGSGGSSGTDTSTLASNSWRFSAGGTAYAGKIASSTFTTVFGGVLTILDFHRVVPILLLV